MPSRKTQIGLPIDSEATVTALLRTPPPPTGDPSTRKQKPRKAKTETLGRCWQNAVEHWRDHRGDEPARKQDRGGQDRTDNFQDSLLLG